MEHKTYFDGKVQSISFTFADGTPATNGVLQEGTFEFSTDKTEKFLITHGKVLINGTECNVGDTKEITGGEKVTLTAVDGPAAYICTYH